MHNYTIIFVIIKIYKIPLIETTQYCRKFWNITLLNLMKQQNRRTKTRTWLWLWWKMPQKIYEHPKLLIWKFLQPLQFKDWWGIIGQQLRKDQQKVILMHFYAFTLFGEKMLNFSLQNNKCCYCKPDYNCGTWSNFEKHYYSTTFV